MKTKEWDCFVENHPEGSFFHLTGWKKVIQNIYRFKPHYISYKDPQGVTQGILPLFEINQITGKKLVSVPFSTEGGILYNTEKAKKELIEKAKSIVEEKDLDYLELRQEKDIGTDLKSKDYYVHMKIKLESDPKLIWKNANKKLRNAIRKARKLKLASDIGKKYLPEFYDVFSSQMKELGTPVDKKLFFKEIIKQFPNNIDIIVSKLDSKVISSYFIIKYKNRYKLEWGASYKKYFGYNASHLTFWRTIEEACKQKYEIIDFGRSIAGEGTYHFKKKFGAEPHQMHYKYYIRKGDMPDIRKDNWKRKVFASCWKNLPLSLANKIGPKIRKNFP